MHRRQLIAMTSAFLASGRVVYAQAGKKVYRIALVHTDISTAKMSKSKGFAYKFFLEELERIGFKEGENLIVERFSANGVFEDYRTICLRAIDTKPDAIIVASDRLTKILKDQTSTIPIIAGTSDPIAYGLTKSLSRPSENITGIMVSSSEAIWQKRLALLKEISPAMRGVFQLSSRSVWESPLGNVIAKAIEGGGYQLIGPPVESPHQNNQYEAAVREAAKQTNICLVTTALENYTNAQLIVDLMIKYRMIAFYPDRTHVELGGLIGHDVDLPNLWRQVAKQVAAVLSGEQIGEIPFYQPQRLRLIVNMNAVKALSITMPMNVLAQADEVID